MIVRNFNLNILTKLKLLPIGYFVKLNSIQSVIHLLHENNIDGFKFMTNILKIFVYQITAPFVCFVSASPYCRNICEPMI